MKKPVVVLVREIRPGEEPMLDVGTNTWTTPDTHYIIRGVRGEEYPITKEIFHETYEFCEEAGRRTVPREP